MIARIHDDGEPKIGSTLSQLCLSIHAGKTPNWVRLQGNVVNVRGETWQANFYNGGRIQGSTLISLPPKPAVRSSRTEQQEHAAAMK